MLILVLSAKNETLRFIFHESQLTISIAIVTSYVDCIVYGAYQFT